jgi:hypothetical protein
VAATRNGFLIVAARPGDGPDLTGDYRIAYQDEDKWTLMEGPDFRGGMFVDLAVSSHRDDVDQLDQIVAVGTVMGRTVFVSGLLVDGRPVFGAMEPQELPYVATPIAIEWTGSYFVVMGLDPNGDVNFVYGGPGAWSESKMRVGREVTLSGFDSAPVYNAGKPGKHYDLLAIGRASRETVTLTGEEFFGVFPALVEKWAVVPGYGRPSLGAMPTASVVSAPAIVASPNPFTDRSTVTVTVGREQPVLIEVFDAIGRRVSVLHNAVLSAGTPHTFTFDAAGLAGGAYHFRVSGVDFDESRQVTLVR